MGAALGKWHWASAAVAAAAVIVSGCKDEAYCFVCERSEPVEPEGGIIPGTGGSGPNFNFDSGQGGGGEAEGGVTCLADLQTDIENCGACGRVCAIEGAFARCENGECVFDRCADGLVNLNGELDDGCECSISNDGVELCDDIDNDCNGETDEGFDLSNDLDNCGACNTACADLPNSTVACVEGACAYTCDEGYSALGQAGIGCPYSCPVFPPQAETCDGRDEDCDGVIDNGDPGAGAPCSDHCPNGNCVGECQPGLTVCTGTATGVACVGGTRPNVELCDGLDNDCDGETDEGYDFDGDPLNCGDCGVQCKVGDLCVGGVCQFLCEPGFKDLDGIPGNQCEYACPVFPEQPEICNGIDEDCDGIADNGATDVGMACTGNCPNPNACVASGDCSPYAISPTDGTCYGVCSDEGVTACVGGLKVCQHADQRVGELCNGLDDNCDGRLDEGFDTIADPDNCGSCGNVCTAPNALAVSCENGTCNAVTACDLGFIDLNGQLVDGCEYSCPVFPPVGELCNGIDDDCDGVVDDNVSGGGQSCASDCPAPHPCVAQGNCSFVVSQENNGCYGTCAFDGRTSCNAGTPQCTHPSRSAETCNGIDDDCDGRIDNGFNLMTDRNNCGVCGFACNLPGATTNACVSGICQATGCAQGFIDADDDPTNGCEYACPVFPTQQETCNGVDDDCDGVIDDAPIDVGTACAGNCPDPNACVSSGNCSPYTISPNIGSCYGVCRTGGLTACIGGVPVCEHPNSSPTESCNGLDDNCDGRVDEGFDTSDDPDNCGTCGNVCTAPNATAVECSGGICGNVTVCAIGFADLNGDPSDGCEYGCPVFPPTGETCNGIDDDCDGVADDTVVGLGQSCTDDCPAPAPCVLAGNCSGPVSNAVDGCYGVCATDGRTSCSAGATVCTHPGQKAEACNGVDDNCNGRVDEGFNLQTDRNNCGACGVVCALPNAGTVSCSGGACRVDNCVPGFANVDGSMLNGCEYACPVFPTQAETCNGVDDDCDGIIDDSPTDVGVACDDNCPNGVCQGICTSGATVCISGQPVCQGGGGVQLEVCNNRDDDCDGTVDNGFNKQTDPLHCGACNNACNLPNTDVHVCSGGTCRVGTCDPGFANQNAVTNQDGCEYSCPVYPPQTETCNGVDDDCDGLTDANDPSMVTPNNFCVQTGPCSGAAPVCQGSNGWRCNYGPNIDTNADGTLSVIERRCDGIDNNCNTQIDETFPLKGQTCTNGDGRCARSTTYTCRPDGTAVECLAVPVPTDAIDEDCNAIDDNCDGQIDEADPEPGAQCYNGGQHACLGWVDPMVQVGSSWVYVYEASRPAATNTDPGVDDSRACSKGNVLPWTSLNQAEAEAACSAVLDGAGDPMRLCTISEWETACRAGNSGVVYSYASSPGTYVSGRCNDVNAGVGGPWATGRNAAGNANMCYANWGGASRIYDLSGNVSEWTGSAETVFGTTYYRVRGGNYQTFPLGTQCGFNFVLQRPEFQNFDLGFRCCSDNAP